MASPQPELEYLFKHALTQEVAYGTLSFANRRMLHARVAEHVESTYAPDLSAWFGILAYHYRLSAQPEKEFEYVRPAAVHAARQYAVRKAAGLYTRAIELVEEYGLGTPDQEFSLRVGRFGQHDILGEYERLPADAAALIDLAQELSQERQIQALIKQGLSKWRNLDANDAIGCYDEAAMLAQEHGDNILLGDALSLRGHAYFSDGDYEQGKKMLLRVIRNADNAGWRQEASACHTLGWIFYDEGDAVEAERYWQRCLTLNQSHGEKQGETRAISNLGSLYGTIAQFEKALECAEQSRAIARQIGYESGELNVLQLLGFVWSAVGEYKKALECYKAAIKLADRHMTFIYERTYNRSRMVEVILEERGSFDEAEALINRAFEIVGDIGGKELMGWLYHFKGLLLMRRGDFSEAQGALTEAARLRLEISQLETYTSTLAKLGELHMQRQDMETARVYVDKLLPLIRPPDGKMQGHAEASLTCFRVLDAANEHELACDVLRDAYQTLQRDAERIDSEELRGSFLKNKSTHREIVGAYRSVFGNG